MENPVISPEQNSVERSRSFPDMIRILDIGISLCGMILLSPLFLLIAILIRTSSKGPAIFRQVRVGQNSVDFILYKFRTMYLLQPDKQSLTIGSRDKRITGAGYYLRKFKLDELPQLYNVLKGDMSIVGPRPELRKFTDLYTPEEKEVLKMKPGITDYASIYFKNESSLLSEQADPEDYYIKHIMPVKIQLNRHYADKRTVVNYSNVIIKTLISVLS